MKRVHGGLTDEEARSAGVDRARLLDFSVNTNPYGPCPAVVDAIRRAPLDRYPDPTARAARERMASWLQVAPEALALGNGAADLLWALARVLLEPGTLALIVEPTFSEFRLAAARAGAHLGEYRAREQDAFRIDLSEVAWLANRCEARVVYLCTPSSPTGVGIAAREIAAWAEARPELHVVLDQSFLSLSDDFADADVPMPPNVIRVRSLTKDHALPGLRVGYLIATPELVDRLERHRPAWSTSAPAQAAAVAAIEQAAFVAESRQRLASDRARLLGELRARGFSPLVSRAPFFLLPAYDAAGLRARLLAQHHVLVRDCTSFGLDRFVRLAVRPALDCARLLAAFEEELKPC